MSQLASTTAEIPLVDYLVLGDEPHLVANECVHCSARFFDRRNACASCGLTEFRSVPVATEGQLRAYTIVAFAAPGVAVPYVAGVVDCSGTAVRANVVNVDPDPEQVHLGQRLRLITVPVGTDSTGRLAVGFGFEPVKGDS